MRVGFEAVAVVVPLRTSTTVCFLFSRKQKNEMFRLISSWISCGNHFRNVLTKPFQRPTPQIRGPNSLALYSEQSQDEAISRMFRKFEFLRKAKFCIFLTEKKTRFAKIRKKKLLYQLYFPSWGKGSKYCYQGCGCPC